MARGRYIEKMATAAVGGWRGVGPSVPSLHSAERPKIDSVIHHSVVGHARSTHYTTEILAGNGAGLHLQHAAIDGAQDC